MNNERPATNIIASKNHLRQHYRTIRRNLTSLQQRIAADAISQTVCNSDVFKQADCVAIYWPDDGEIHTSQIIDAAWAAKKNVFLPFVERSLDASVDTAIDVSSKMQFRPFFPQDTLIPSRWGIMVPDNRTQSIESTTFDLIVVPLVAFDAECNRLGRGGGFYDGMLAQTKRQTPNQPVLKKPYTIGLAHSTQQADNIPTQLRDIPLDNIITESDAFFRKR